MPTLGDAIEVELQHGDHAQQLAGRAAEGPAVQVRLGTLFVEERCETWAMAAVLLWPAPERHVPA